MPPTVLTGRFTVTNQQAPTDASATFQIQPQAGGSAVTSVTTDKPVYLVGQPVKLTFTETNQGSVPVQVIAGSGTFDVSQNGNPVWVSGPDGLDPDPSFSWQTLRRSGARRKPRPGTGHRKLSRLAPCRGLSR